jgi:glyoxylase-like metal-dependent hydrolase (beta-lactamase superfamily II)
MLQEMVDVIQKGDERGNSMLIRLRLPSGLEILGLPTENNYGGGWDLGPTWNYLVSGDRPFLVDSGRVGSGGKLLDMIKSVGLSGEDLDFILVSHGHEDHDGGLAEIEKTIGTRIKAHLIYDRLIRFYPGKAPPDGRKDFPASCWRCFMPESYSTKYCRGYHLARNGLNIEPVQDGHSWAGETFRVYHVPGHSPDSLAVLMGGEVVIVGDTLLPDITPWPSQEAFFTRVSEILRPEYTRAPAIYGLRAYITSLKRLRQIGREFPNLLVLPAHRFFFNNQWNEIHLETRTNALIQHHINRCGDILQILSQGPKTAREIAVKYFEAHLLKGFGVLMAENEILSHCELLGAAKDIIPAEDGRFRSTGSTNFESTIQSLDPERENLSR